MLDGQAQQLRAENAKLVELADKLKAEVCALKNELRWHVNNGCKVVDPNNGGVIGPGSGDAGSMQQHSDSPDSTTSPASKATATAVVVPPMPPNKAYLADNDFRNATMTS